MTKSHARLHRWLFPVFVLALALLGTTCAHRSSDSSSDSALRTLAERVFPYVEQYDYFGVCGVDGDTSNCPYTARLAQRLKESSATLCRCQNPSPTREIRVSPAQGGGVIRVSLNRGSVNFELQVITEGGRLLVDDERCVGQGRESSIYETIQPCQSS